MTNLDEENKLPPAEWQVIHDEILNGVLASDSEREYEPLSAGALAERHQFANCILGDYPVTVLKIYNAGVAAGNGTDEQRASMKVFMERMPIEEERASEIAA